MEKNFKKFILIVRKLFLCFFVLATVLFNLHVNQIYASPSSLTLRPNADGTYSQLNEFVNGNVFSNGFEEGDFTGWTSTNVTSGNTLEYLTTARHHGTGGAHSHQAAWASNAYSSKIFDTTYTTFYVRMYLYLNTFELMSGYGRDYITIYNNTGGAAMGMLQIYNDAGTYKWRLGVYYDGGLNYTLLETDNPVASRWYSIETYIKFGNGNGEAKFYLDGVEKISLSGLNNPFYARILFTGQRTWAGGQSSESDCYFDCVVASTSYIGPEDRDTKTNDQSDSTGMQVSAYTDQTIDVTTLKETHNLQDHTSQIGTINNVTAYMRATSSTTHYYGNKFIIDDSLAHSLDSSSKKLSFRFTSQQSKTCTQFRIYINTVTGTPPTYRFGIQTNSSGLPSGTWLAYVDIAPTATGPLTVDISDQNLTAGTIYHIVIEYVSGTIDASNNISIWANSPPYQLIPYDQSTDANQNVVYDNGSGWVVYSRIPVYILDWSDATYEGVPYLYYVGYTIHSSNNYGEQFTISDGDKNIYNIAFYVGKSGSPADNLYVSLYDVTDAEFDIQDLLFATASELGTFYSWIIKSITPRVLENNHQYKVFLQSPNSISPNSYSTRGQYTYWTEPWMGLTWGGTTNGLITGSDDPPTSFNTEREASFYFNYLNVLPEARILWRTYDTDYESANQQISESTFADYYEQRTTNPNTGLAWTWDEIDSLQIGARTPVLANGESISVSDFWIVVDYNVPPDNPSSLGPSKYVDGSWANDDNPTLNFTQSDPELGDTLKYRIQIDDTSDFSSPVVDYTSVLISQGATSFTVGQAAGSGTYTQGSQGQTLTNGSYYWQVMSEDQSTNQSSWAQANSGNVAFKISIGKVYKGVTNTVYSNGTVTYSGQPNSSNLIDFSILPSIGSIEVTILTWNTSGGYYKKWTENGSLSGIVTDHTVGDLKPNTKYNILVGNSVFKTKTSNNQGKLSFIYNKGYSERTFQITPTYDDAGTGMNPWYILAAALIISISLFLLSKRSRRKKTKKI